MRTYTKITAVVLLMILALSGCEKGGIKTETMTPEERANPEIIKGSRKRRIALGSGRQVQDVNRLLRQFQDVQNMMKQMQAMQQNAGKKGKKGMRSPFGNLPFM